LFLTSRSTELSELQKATQPRSFGGIALNRVLGLVQDELRWIHKLESQIESNKGDV